jgi:hypothetical protein
MTKDIHLKQGATELGLRGLGEERGRNHEQNNWQEKLVQLLWPNI